MTVVVNTSHSEDDRMPAKKKGPRMVREIFRLRAAGLGCKAIAKSLGISKNTVKTYLRHQEKAPEDDANGQETSLEKLTASKQPAWALQVD